MKLLNHIQIKEVVSLRDNSLLIESLNNNIPITFNSGINLLSHNGIKV